MPIESYIESRSSAEDDYLYRLWRATNIHLVRPHMVSGHVEGLLLKMLVEMIRPANVLEIGTFTGYSAISMSYGLPSHGRIYTFDVNEELRPPVDRRVAPRVQHNLHHRRCARDFARFRGKKWQPALRPRLYRRQQKAIRGILHARKKISFPGRIYSRRQYALGRACDRPCI